MGKASKQPRAKALEKTESNSQEPNKTSDSSRRGPKRTSEEIIVDHLPPMGLVFTVLVCSGFLFVYSFRDVFATGKNIGGAMDQAMLVCIIDWAESETFPLWGFLTFFLYFLDLYKFNSIF